MNTQNVITEIRSHPTAQFTVKTHTLREKTNILLITDLKVVDGDKVWKERKDVFNFEQVAAGQTVHGFLNIFFLLHHMLGDFQPKLFPQLLIILWEVSAGLGQVHVYLRTIKKTTKNSATIEIANCCL